MAVKLAVVPSGIHLWKPRNKSRIKNMLCYIYVVLSLISCISLIVMTLVAADVPVSWRHRDICSYNYHLFWYILDAAHRRIFTVTECGMHVCFAPVLLALHSHDNTSLTPCEINMRYSCHVSDKGKNIPLPIAWAEYIIGFMLKR